MTHGVQPACKADIESRISQPGKNRISALNRFARSNCLIQAARY